VTTIPDKYEMITGTWDTDATFDPAQGLSGDGAVLLGDTPVAASTRYEDFIAVTEGEPYRLSAVMQSDDITAGYTFTTKIFWFDEDKVALGTPSTTIYSDVPASANTWYTIAGLIDAPSGARHAKPQFEKSANEHFIIVDSFVFMPAVVAFHAYRNGAAQIAGTGAWTRMNMDGEVYDFGSHYNSSTYRFTAPATGVYALLAAQGMSAPAVGAQFDIALYKNGAAWIKGTSVTNATSGNVIRGIVSHPGAYLVIGDYIEVYVYNSGSNSLCYNGSIDSLFSGAQVESP